MFKETVMLNAAATAERLLGHNNILILTHQYPDGDTLGSGFALCRALLAAGKTARVICSDEIPARYDYLSEGMPFPEFEPEFICAVDVADTLLLGEALSVYADKINLCIDHHPSNKKYSDELFLEPQYAATAVMIYELIREIDVHIDESMASCIYTGIATDTGCFKYANTDAYSLRVAADMMEAGANFEMINRSMFDIKTRARIELERRALGEMRFFLDGRCAVMAITLDMVKQSGATEDDLEGLAPLPRQIEGVWAGVTMRERADGKFKISIRSGNHVDASAVCGSLGGGGHHRAAGCMADGPKDTAAMLVVDAIAKHLEEKMILK